MVFRNKNILLISPEPWDHIFVSKHHYAVHLARMGNRVFFLNPPSGKISLKATGYPNLSTIEYKGFVRGMRYLPALLRKEIMRMAFRRLQQLCGVRFDVVWSFDNSVFFDFNFVPSNTLAISHIVDLNQDFQTKTAASTAHYCFCTSDILKERLLKYNQKSFKINHGFNLPAPTKVVDLPVKKGTIRALYSGNIAMPYIDWILLRTVVKSHPEVEFVFVGPDCERSTGNLEVDRAKNDVVQSPNAQFVGRMDSDALQQFYKAADILIIAYQERFQNYQANPHKMMEYLGSGKLVVASFTHEYADLKENGLIIMSRKNEEYPALFNQALTQLTVYNNERFQQARMEYALENSYDRQIERIQNIIADN